MAGKGFKLADAYVEVHGDGSEVVDDVAQDVAQDGGKTRASGLSMGKKLVGGIVGAIAVAKIADFLGDSISAASDLNETISASQQIFGANAKAIEKWGNTASTSMGLSKQAAIDAATSFGDMFLQLGFSGDAAEANSTKIVQMAADLGSFKNLPTGDVLDMISGAMRGEYDSLQRVIPNINAARVEHEALTETGKKSASALTAQEKAQATMNIIMKDGSRAAGDYARTAGGVANQQKTAAAQTEDLKAKLGTALLPVVRQVLKMFNDFMPVIQGVADWIGKNTAIVGPLVVALGILAVAVWAVNTAMFANPVTWIIAGIVALIAVIVLLVTNWDAVVKWITTIWQGFVSWIVSVLEGFVGWWNGIWAGFFGFVTDVWNGFIGWILGVWGGFVGWIMDGLNTLAAFWNGLWAGLGQFVTDVWNGFVAWITSVFLGYVGWLMGMGNSIIGWWNGLWSGIASFISGIWNGIVSGAQSVWNGLISWFQGLGGRIMAVFNGAISWLADIGSNIVNGLWNGIKDAWNGFMSWWNKTVGGIADIAKNMLGIHSPSLVMRQEVGVQIVEGARLGLEDRLPALTRTVKKVFTFDSDALTAGFNGVGLGAGAPSKAKDGDVYNIESITIDAKNVREFTDVVNTLKAMPQVARAGRGATAGVR